MPELTFKVSKQTEIALKMITGIPAYLSAILPEERTKLGSVYPDPVKDRLKIYGVSIDSIELLNTSGNLGLN